MAGGITEIDVHGLTAESALDKVDDLIKRAGKDVYRIRIIHGFHGGIRIRSMIREEYSYERNPRVKRIEMGDNQGITELVLREY